MREKVADVLPKITVRAMNAEQLRQLAAGEEQGDPALEPDHYAFGDEINDGARPGEPGDEEHDRHEHRGRRGQTPDPARIAAGNSAEGRSGKQRDGGGHGDRSVPRTAEQPE